jgi:hypothetical protein
MRPIRKIAFVSPHCVLDFTNGAATATLDGLSLLATLGFQCDAFCNTHVDAWEEVAVEEVLAQRRTGCLVRDAQIGPYRGRLIFTAHGQVPVTLFKSASSRGRWSSPDEIAAFLAGCEIFLRRSRPDLVWTYGGDPVSVLLQRSIRALGIPILFALHNFGYRDPSIFAPTDHVIVPTQLAQRFYRDSIGLSCRLLPLVVDAARVRVTKSEISNLKFEISNKAEIQEGKIGNGTRSVPPAFVTFVNPEPRKGVHVFARIAEVLARRRPDVPCCWWRASRGQTPCGDWASIPAAWGTWRSCPTGRTRGSSTRRAGWSSCPRWRKMRASWPWRR